MCLRISYRYAHSPGEAEDIAQESVLRAWRNRSSLREAASRNRWLAVIVRREAYRYYQRPRPDPTDLFELEGEEDQSVVATVERADLRAALAAMSERDRDLLKMRYEEDMTQEAIADRLGVPLGTVKVRLHRARHKLRRLYVA